MSVWCCIIALCTPNPGQPQNTEKECNLTIFSVWWCCFAVAIQSIFHEATVIATLQYAFSRVNESKR